MSRAGVARAPRLLLLLLVAVLAGCGRSMPTNVPRPVPPMFDVMDWPYDITRDGRTLIYRHRPSKDLIGGVYMLSTDPGSRPTLLYADSLPFFVNDCRLSPDGSKITYTRDFRSDIYVLNVKDGTDTRVTFTDGNARAPDWDPTGRWIVYMRVMLTYGEPDSIGGIHIVDTETLEDRTFRAQGSIVFGADPRWSPDSLLITYSVGTRLENGRTPDHIYVAKSNGTGTTDITPNEYTRNDEYPLWLGPSEGLVFESYGWYSAFDHTSQMIRADGSGRTTLAADLRPYIGFAAVAPTVKKFVYTGPDSSGKWGVVLLRDLNDGTGSTVRQLTVYLPPSDLSAALSSVACRSLTWT